MPGYYSGGCAPGSRRDATCLPCLNGPGTGLYTWTRECNYECASGFYRVNGTLCVPCSRPLCSAGSYASECSDAADSECVQCAAPVSGPLVWTAGGGCNDFVCADGFYLGNAECVKCSAPACFPGFRSVGCTRTADASCVPCDAPVGGAGVQSFRWSEAVECTIECVAGYYYSTANRTCLSCSQRACAAGTYEVGCNRTADKRCLDCPTPSGAFAWISGCSFACINGWSWQNGSMSCAACSKPVCAPGTYASACTPLSDSVCVSCAGTGDGRAWTLGCEFGCLSGYYLNPSSPSQCKKCSSPACAAGTQLRACNATSDAVCVPCERGPTGRFAWTAGCNFTCNGGSYLSGGDCVGCSTPWCAPGTRAGPCSASADAACVACPVPTSVEGSFVWTGDGECSYECATGYFKHPLLAVCTPCSTDGCDAGFHRVGCAPYADAVCEACSDGGGDVGGTVWTRGCEFVCNGNGFYLQRVSGQASRCVACSRPQCPSVGWYPSVCNATSDSVCTRCPMASLAGVRWTMGCWFECNAGYYRVDGGCSVCSALPSQCGPGRYALPCSATSDSRCVACVAPSVDGYAWIGRAGCEFTCVAGFFRNGTACVPCSYDVPLCGPGFQSVACSVTRDSHCVPCAGGGEGVVWTSGCDFECAAGFYFHESSSSCLACSPPAAPCPLGFYREGCNLTRDTFCERCLAPGVEGSFTWIDSYNNINVSESGKEVGGQASTTCLSQCSPGFYSPLNTSNNICVPLPPPPPPTPPEPLAFVVVSTALAMNNTADAVCTELSTLLQALSDAMNAVLGGGEDGLSFVTNVTAFNGRQCVENQCPQCAVVEVNTSSSHGRRLLLASTGVELSTVSTSTAPVPVSSPAVQPVVPLVAELQAAVAVSLAQAAPSLAPLGVVAEMSSVSVQSPPVVKIERNPTALYVQAGLVVGIVLLLVGAASVYFCIQFVKEVGRASKTEVGGHRPLVGGGPSNSAASADLVWMPSIRLRQRSCSRERRAADV